MCFCHGFLTLKWKYWATIIKKPIAAAERTTYSSCQMLTTSKVANMIFDAPTMVRIKSLNSYCLNSLTILSNLNTQTNRMDNAMTTFTMVSKVNIFTVFEWAEIEIHLNQLFELAVNKYLNLNVRKQIAQLHWVQKIPLWNTASPVNQIMKVQRLNAWECSKIPKNQCLTLNIGIRKERVTKKKCRWGAHPPTR